MKAKIEKHGNFDYRWTISNFRGYSNTRSGAIKAAKKEANSIRKYISAKQNAEVIEV